MDRRRKTRKWIVPLCAAALLICGLGLWTASAEGKAHWTPDYPKIELAGILEQQTLSEEDYRTLLLQTGLGPYVVDTLRAAGRAEEILAAQETFFNQPAIECEPNSPISREEHTDSGARLAALEDGDILITPCSHVLGWRNGHAALVVDAAQGLTLESVVLGEDACIQTVEKWETYPAVLVFRLRGVDGETRAAVAAAAQERLWGVPYGLTVGILSEKYTEEAPTTTHCAHLVWDAYRSFGYDLDSDGGRIVTPRDLANSPLLELKQVYGMDPRTLWEK